MDIHIHGNPARLYAGADPGFWKGGGSFSLPSPSFPPFLPSPPFPPLPSPPFPYPLPLPSPPVASPGFRSRGGTLLPFPSPFPSPGPD